MSALSRLPRLMRVLLLMGVLAAVPPLLTRVAPSLFSGLEANIVGTGTYLATAALALNILMGYAGQISLGHFALLGVGAFATGVMTSPTRLALPYLLAVPVAAVLGGLVALVIGLPALRLRGLYLAIATIGFSYAMEQSVFRVKGLSGGSGGIDVPRPIAGSFTFLKTADYVAILLVLLVAVWALDVNLTRSRLGRAFQAIRADEAVASSFGIDVARYKLLAFVLSGAVAGVAGAMYGGLVGTVSASAFGYQFSLLLVVLVVVGGLGSRLGVVIAAYVFAVMPRLFVDIFGEGIRGWDLIIGAALLMVAVRNHPGGVAEALRERKDKRTARRAQAAGLTDDPNPATPALPQMPRPASRAESTPLQPGQPVLRVSGLTVRFGGLVAVNEADLVVPRGQIVGLIGPNGAGKTTMFNAISGLVRPTEGRIELLGRDVTADPGHRRAAAGMGRTFQNIGLAKDLSVTENLLLAQHSVAEYSGWEALMSVRRAPRVERELRERAREAVVALGFERYADTPVRQLSHGQQRIVELGAVLVTAPELVMLDEPSAGMSPGAAENLAVRLRDIRDQLGRTVLLIEHNIPLVLDVCDTLTVLSAGRVIAAGDVDEVARQAEVVSAYLGEAVPA
ncbi:MAG TPA: branched-chain amino acid ABC transporter ATP-binding protein/permease [Mycobacteriales bacterium]|nr:branched-chain amino acid ABC transporter ATP-binding protein/permease [Mycobacteriales bacterium]